MNEKLKKLIKKAGGEVKITGGVHVYIDKSNLDVAKFAELIVRECAEVCKAQSTYDPIVLPYKPSEQFEKAIREHFGVK